jgi:hypothetical protein
VHGERIIPTRLRGNVTIREENADVALAVMSRFAADPRWLIDLPPTSSPCETSGEAGLLEHPAEAFAYYRGQGAPVLICEEKHMGSRAVVAVCRDETAAREHFGISSGEAGIVTTRTGRRFFNEPESERQFLGRVQTALSESELRSKGHLGTSLSCRLRALPADPVSRCGRDRSGEPACWDRVVGSSDGGGGRGDGRQTLGLHRRVHGCVFAILAPESEPEDPES